MIEVKKTKTPTIVQKKDEYKSLCESEWKFMKIVWDQAPINSGLLVKICQEKLGWKKSTTYTVVKKMEEKKWIENQESIVKPVITRAEARKNESLWFVDRTFDGSLMSFLETYLQSRTLSLQEIERLQDLASKLTAIK